MSQQKDGPNGDSGFQNTIFKEEKSILLNHNYDGIQELDHPLPKWWLGIFYATMIFSALYVGYYMFGGGPGLRDELAMSLEEIKSKQTTVAASEGFSNDVILAALQDDNKIKLGAEVYTGKCAACHGDKGQGLVGPNLTDNAWLHGQGRPADIAKVIAEGVADKGMPPWGTVISSDELLTVTAYVRRLYGTHPAGAKEPQGQTYEIENL